MHAENVSTSEMNAKKCYSVSVRCFTSWVIILPQHKKIMSKKSDIK